MSPIRPYLYVKAAMLGAIALAACSVGQAQQNGTLGQNTVLYPQPYPGMAATIGQSHAYGMADLIRSAGTADLMHSEAARNYEQARSMNFDNRLKYTQGYFTNRQLNDDYRRAMRGQRPTAEQLFRIAHQRAPEPLSPSELDPYSGEISWPVILMGPEYADQRTIINDIVRLRTTDVVSLTVDQRTALRAALDSLAQELKSNITAYDPSTYTTAKNFLQSLAATTGVGMIY